MRALFFSALVDVSFASKSEASPYASNLGYCVGRCYYIILVNNIHSFIPGTSSTIGVVNGTTDASLVVNVNWEYLHAKYAMLATT